jgi:hypothetical protein
MQRVHEEQFVQLCAFATLWPKRKLVCHQTIYRIKKATASAMASILFMELVVRLISFSA